MVEFFVLELKAFWAWLLVALGPWVWPTIVLLLGMVALSLIAAHLDARRGSGEAPNVSERALQVGQALALLALVGVLATLVGIGQRAVDRYLMVRNAQRFDSQSVVSGTAVNQFMPSVSLVIPEFRVQHRLVPESDLVALSPTPQASSARQWLAMAGYAGAELLSQRPASPGYVRLVFRVSDPVERAVTVDRAVMDLRLSPVADADPRGNAYRVRARLEFTWRNATDAAWITRFRLPLPENGGTLTDLRAALGDVQLVSPTQERSFVGETRLGAGQSVTAVVEYTTDARGNLRVYPGSERRAIPDLTVRLRSEMPVVLERGALSPTERRDGETVWSLKDALTDQIISVAVRAQRSDRELVWKLGYLLPLGWLTFVGLCLVGGETGRQPFRVVLGATTAFALATSLPLWIPLTTNMFPWLAVLGAVMGVATVGVLLDRRAGAFAALGAVVALSAVAGPATALLVWFALVIGAVAVTVMGRKGPRLEPM